MNELSLSLSLLITISGGAIKEYVCTFILPPLYLIDFPETGLSDAGAHCICTRSRVGDFTEESRIVLAKGGETRKGDLLGIVSELPAN